MPQNGNRILPLRKRPKSLIIKGMIIGIAGPTASGKTTVAKMLEERFGAFRIRYSSILSELAKERGLDPDDKATLQGIFLTEREAQGEDFLTKELEKRVLTVTNPFIVIEGNRRLVDIETLKRIAEKRGEKLLLLFIDASREARFLRYNHRLHAQGEPHVSFEAFTALEANAAEDQIDDIRMIFSRDGKIISTDNKNEDEVFKQVAELLEEQ
jgi:dephospho-CoA kinase